MVAKGRVNHGTFLLSYGFIITLVAMIVLFSVLRHEFFTLKNGIFILHAAAPTMILATGVAFVLMTGKIDISIGSIAYLSAGIGVMLMMHANVHPLPAVLIIFLLGAALGAVNGFIVVVLRVNPLITTLGTLFTSRGLALQITNSLTISISGRPRQLRKHSCGPDFHRHLHRGGRPGHLSAHPYAERFRQACHGHRKRERDRPEGRSSRGPDLVPDLCPVGIDGQHRRRAHHVQVGSISPSLGSGYEFTAIALLVIGGVSLFGGEGTIVPGIALGALTLTIIQSGLKFHRRLAVRVPAGAGWNHLHRHVCGFPQERGCPESEVDSGMMPAREKEVMRSTVLEGRAAVRRTLFRVSDSRRIER